MPLLNPPAVIFFDLDGTLRHSRPSSIQAFLDFAAQLGVDQTPRSRWTYARWAHAYWAQSPELADDLDACEGDDAAFWTNYALRGLLNLGVSPDCSLQLAPQVYRYMAEAHRPEDFIPPDVPPTLELLKAAGFRLGVLSNRDRPFHAQLVELGLAGYFELALASCEALSWKPDPGIFLIGLQRMSVPPSQAIYVGDNYYADVIGARRAGLQPILLDPAGLFPEADCPIIAAIGDLPALLL